MDLDTGGDYSYGNSRVSHLLGFKTGYSEAHAGVHVANVSATCRLSSKPA